VHFPVHGDYGQVMKRPRPADEDHAMKRSPALTALRLRGSHGSSPLADGEHGDDDASPLEAVSAPEPETPGGVDAHRLIGDAGANFTAALDAACEAASYLAGGERATVRLIEGLQLRAWATTDGGVAQRVAIANSVEGIALRENQVVLCNDAAADERVPVEVSRRLGARSWLVLPLAFRDELVGTLSVSAAEPGLFAAPQHARQVADGLRDIADALQPHLQTAAWLLERDRAREETQGQINETQITAEMMTEGVIVFGADGHFLRANNAAARLLGTNIEQIAGRHVRDALRSLLREDGTEWVGEEQPPAMTLATGVSYRDVIMGVQKQGVPRWVSVSSRILPDAHGAPNGVVVVLTDCSERRGLREQLAHATLHDEPTGLPNKRLLHLELDETIDRSRRQGLGVALVHVCLTDLPGLRSRIRAHGADDVLRTIAGRVVQTVRDGDMVARPGDDEFAAVLGLLSDSQRAVDAFLERVRSSFVTPVELGRSSVTVEARFIVSLFPRDGHTAEALLRHAALERLNGRLIA